MGRRKWTKERVVEAIRARQQQGLPLKGVLCDNRALVRAAVRRFGDWQQALAAAGIADVSRYVWNRERVIGELQAWARRGLPLRSRRLNQSLRYAVYQYFDSWYDALAAAGLEPLGSKPKPRRTWTPRDVIKEIQARQAQGITLTVANNNSLAKVAGRHFGTWTSALVAAGLQPRLRIEWTKERLLEELRVRHEQGAFADSTCAGEQAIGRAARKYFGSWRNALVAAGILAPGERERQKGKWTRQTILETIQDRYIRGLSLAASKNRSLAAAAALRFGSWHDALKAAGIQVGEKPKPRKRWSRERVIEAIQERQRRGLKMTNVAETDTALVLAARRHLGGWRAALIAAEVVPEGARQKPPEKWSKQRVIQEVQARYQQGLPLRSNWPGNRLLASAAERHCGGWSQALVDAGIPQARRPFRKCGRQRVIDALQARQRQGLSLARQRAGRSLTDAARRHFGGWHAALSAAGVVRGEGDE